MNVKVVKLITGEEVVAQIEMGDVIRLTNPITLFPTDRGVAMAPFCAVSADKTYDIKPEHVLFINNVFPEIEAGYTEKFGGIVIPKKGLIT